MWEIKALIFGQEQGVEQSWNLLSITDTGQMSTKSNMFSERLQKGMKVFPVPIFLTTDCMTVFLIITLHFSPLFIHAVQPLGVVKLPPWQS